MQISPALGIEATELHHGKVQHPVAYITNELHSSGLAERTNRVSKIYPDSQTPEAAAAAGKLVMNGPRQSNCQSNQENPDRCAPYIVLSVVTESKRGYLQNIEGTSQNDHHQQAALDGKKQPPSKEVSCRSARAGCTEARSGPPVENGQQQDGKAYQSGAGF